MQAEVKLGSRPVVLHQEDVSQQGLEVGVVHGAVGRGSGLAHRLGHLLIVGMDLRDKLSQMLHQDLA